MNQKRDNRHELLKAAIQTRFGRKISYAKDCRELAELIKIKTKRHIGASTIKRFFGIIQNTFSHSNYTLDTLSMFLGFENWQQFIEKNESVKLQRPEIDSWENLKRRTEQITNISLKSLKDKVGTRLRNYPYRKFADKRFTEFLASSKIATTFVAPDGYGKTPIVIQLSEKFFTGQNPICPNDILCLVDGSILYNLVTHNQKINRLYNLLNFDPQNSFSAFFRAHPDRVKGKFILIIDGIDDIYPVNGKTVQFIDNLLKMISSYKNIDWFKILITCTPRIWRIISGRVNTEPMLKPLWYNVMFQQTANDFINIPLLRKKEIEKILKKNRFSFCADDLQINYPDIFENIKNPYILHLFMHHGKTNGNCGDIDLLNHFIKNTILSPPLAKEKYEIIQEYFKLCDYGKKNSDVNKNDLTTSFSNTLAYTDLIRLGFLYEYSLADERLSLNTYIKFSHNELFAYYLANILLKNGTLVIPFIKNTIAAYRNSPLLQNSLLKYIIKILFKEEQVEILKDIFSIFKKDNLAEDISNPNMPCSICDLTHFVSNELRKYPKLRKRLLPCYAKSEVAGTLYFERFFDMDRLMLYAGDELDLYLRYNPTNEAKRYVHFIKFMQYFLGENAELCKKEYLNAANLPLPKGNDPLNSSYYFVPQIIYQLVYEGKVETGLLTAVYTIAGKLFQNNVQRKTETPQFEFAILFALHYGKANREIIELARYIFENYDFSHLKLSVFYQLFLSVYASALLASGEPEKAFEVNNQVRLKQMSIPDNIKYYTKIKILFIKAEFLIYSRKIKKAQIIMEQIKILSKKLQFKYFYNMALLSENEIKK